MGRVPCIRRAGTEATRSAARRGRYRRMEGNVIRLVSLVLGGVLVSAGVSHGQPGDKAMTVFVTAAPLADVKKVDKETETRLLAAIKDAETKRKDLEKS